MDFGFILSVSYFPDMRHRERVITSQVTFKHTLELMAKTADSYVKVSKYVRICLLSRILPKTEDIRQPFNVKRCQKKFILQAPYTEDEHSGFVCSMERVSSTQPHHYHSARKLPDLLTNINARIHWKQMYS